MSNGQSRHYFIIWVWLLLLMIISVAAASMLPKFQAMVLIFTIAIVKALLVAWNYMHLRHEKAIIYAIVLLPLTFIIILLFGLFPDFVYRS